VTIKIDPPPGYGHMTLEEVRAHFRKLLDEAVARIHAERRAQGLPAPLGAQRVLEQDPLESSGDTFPTFGRNPRIACLDPVRRRALLRQLQEWRVRHRIALGAWRQGQRDVRFPAGTYGMRRHHGACVDAHSTDPPPLD
jgi:hypothetical protein